MAGCGEIEDYRFIDDHADDRKSKRIFVALFRLKNSGHKTQELFISQVITIFLCRTQGLFSYNLPVTVKFSFLNVKHKQFRLFSPRPDDVTFVFLYCLFYDIHSVLFFINYYYVIHFSRRITVYELKSQIPIDTEIFYYFVFKL